MSWEVVTHIHKPLPGASRGSLRRISGNLFKVRRRENSRFRHSNLVNDKLDEWNSASFYKLAGKDCNGSGSKIWTVIGYKDWRGRGALRKLKGYHQGQAHHQRIKTQAEVVFTRWNMRAPSYLFLSFLAWLLLPGMCHPALTHTPLPPSWQAALPSSPAPCHSPHCPEGSLLFTRFPRVMIPQTAAHATCLLDISLACPSPMPQTGHIQNVSPIPVSL